jgi:hypothetical protein
MSSELGYDYFCGNRICYVLKVCIMILELHNKIHITYQVPHMLMIRWHNYIKLGKGCVYKNQSGRTLFRTLHKRELRALGCPFLKGSPDAAVKLLPCDYEVMDSSHENNLLQKCRKMLHCIHKTQSGRILCKRKLCALGCSFICREWAQVAECRMCISNGRVMRTYVHNLKY